MAFLRLLWRRTAKPLGEDVSGLMIFGGVGRVEIVRQESFSKLPRCPAGKLDMASEARWVADIRGWMAAQSSSESTQSCRCSPPTEIRAASRSVTETVSEPHTAMAET